MEDTEAEVHSGATRELLHFSVANLKVYLPPPIAEVPVRVNFLCILETPRTYSRELVHCWYPINRR